MFNISRYFGHFFIHTSKHVRAVLTFWLFSTFLGYFRKITSGHSVGDLGGPLVGEQNGKSVIFGVVHDGHSNRYLLNKPSIYTDVYANLKFIQNKLVVIHISNINLL